MHDGVIYTYAQAYSVVQLLLYNIQRSSGCNNTNATICDNNNLCHAPGLFCLPIVMEKKIVNTSTIDVNDNNFGFDNYFNRDFAFDLDHDIVLDSKQRPTY